MNPLIALRWFWGLQKPAVAAISWPGATPISSVRGNSPNHGSIVPAELNIGALVAAPTSPARCRQPSGRRRVGDDICRERTRHDCDRDGPGSWNP